VTRRDSIRLAAAAVALRLGVRAAPALADAEEDRMKREEKVAVAAAVAGEQAAMVAFEAIANSGVLDHAATATMRVLLAHARVHVDTLGQGMTDELGQDPPLAPKRTEIAGLAGLRRPEQALRLALRLEQRAIAAHLGAVQKTHDAVLLKAFAGIVGSDAQSLVLLRRLLREDPVPAALERGAA
jgi:hypothetical protein